MLGRVMDGEAVPDLTTGFGPVAIRERFAVVGVEMVHHQVDGLGLWVLCGQMKVHLRELDRRAVRRWRM